MAVYFLRQRGTNFVKIGWAKDPADRLKTLQTGSPSDFELMATREGGAKEEAVLHRRFAGSNVRGEWFRMTGPLAVEIALCDHTFARLAALEPWLLEIAHDAGEVEFRPGHPFCAASEWYGYDGRGLKERLVDVVGHFRKKPRGADELSTSDAYDAAYDTLRRLLPDCFQCNCLTAGGVFGDEDDE